MDRDTTGDLLQSLFVLSATVEARDPYTGGHFWRVSQYSRLLGERIGLPPAALDSMSRPNLAAARAARDAGARAATDVTGFGLAGHLAGMLRASGVSAIVDVTALPALPGALELLARGLRSTSHAANEKARRGMVVTRDAAAHPNLPLLFDPQTSGACSSARRPRASRTRSGGSEPGATRPPP